jgi:tRNA G18 (ribose-2'-O)-methylase SpoU
VKRALSAFQYTLVSTGGPWGADGVLLQAAPARARSRDGAHIRVIDGRTIITAPAPRRYPARVSLPIIVGVEELDHADDPRLDDYRQLKEKHLNAVSGRFVAESERVVRRLLASRLRVLSVLVTAPRLEAMRDVLGGPFPVYLATQPVLDAIAGFHVHRGCLAIGERPPPAPWRPLPPGARAAVVLEDLVDVDNLGAMARNAAAFGADALLLSPRCADPFYRKAIRVSLGSVFELPIARVDPWPDGLAELRAQGLALVAGVLASDATPLPAFRPPARFALLLGTEGPGLSEAAIRQCDHRVTIPMSPGADSLNVATAGAVLLYALLR